MILYILFYIIFLYGFVRDIQIGEKTEVAIFLKKEGS